MSKSPVIGTKIAFDGEKEYKEAIRNINSGLGVLNSEMKKTTAVFAENADSIEALNAKNDVLERKLYSQQEKLDQIREALQKATDAYGEADRRTMEWQKSLYEAEAAVAETEKAIRENSKAIETGMQEAQSATQGLGSALDDLAKKFGLDLPEGIKESLNGMESFSTNSVAAMGAAAAAVAAVIKALKDLSAMTIEVAATADEYLTASLITGVPTQMIQAWNYASELIDVDAETIMNAMVKITKAMGDAAAGNEAAIERFKDLGVSITDTDGELRSAQEVFYDFVDALGQIENATERDVVAQDMLGKSYGDVIPLVHAGSDALKMYYREAEAVGYILSNDQVKALGEVDDAWQKLQLTIEAQKMQLAAQFAPAAKEALELFCDWSERAGRFLRESGLIENLATIITSLVDVAKDVDALISSIPGLDTVLTALKATLGAIAQFCALIADTADVVTGVLTGDWNKAKTGLGWNKNNGEASHWQSVYMQQEGTYQQYADYYNSKNNTVSTEPEDVWYGEITRNIYDHNAAGTRNWRGGLTWVGENGPELVSLPRGSRIMNAQESRNHEGIYVENFQVSIDAKNVQDINDIVNLVQRARVHRRMK